MSRNMVSNMGAQGIDLVVIRSMMSVLMEIISRESISLQTDLSDDVSGNFLMILLSESSVDGKNT